ncbi:type-F conjugative transfer system pilin assembly thiol-disulfide isomerase TrbB [Lelliottia nimipressuralis]|jgi:type-F conjugative transfer system pilin assembly thiol-disulfide isomerase TrbB|uniref:Type-F conjugative transfer system pilin assembly thiol-disulfide isomerase TrbB n=1 Tax=Lelliottia nimipressuralis TaxID=69220 RepID=A0ABY3NX95_9ENTR|nr:type-F conjugative transfer system pilin assembly thiol-disulfide isomerase TrbB [Lelliottia nimipressuralis]RXJ10744.1 type-F conjugative transfer system pilin assembly thiol-disulfide isomerase TrbB [Lelliottia nimipressuralis]TYT29246.1 type-F conjugative transfer system pilin assembly thiol-disulfide isomerase TrbB [Lelliottia nimipressuralis]
MNAKILIAGSLLVASACAFAGSTVDEIRALDAAKAAAKAARDAADAQPGTSAPEAIPHRLSDGRTVNLADWTVVLFMQSSCEYSQKFDPVLKGFSDRTGLPVFPFSMDGKGDMTFPNVLSATPDVILEYFQTGLPLATPTTFLTNVHTMETYPLLQQYADEMTFASRLDEVFRLALDRHQPSSNRIPKA